MTARGLAFLEVLFWLVGFRPIEYVLIIGLYVHLGGPLMASVLVGLALVVACIVAGVLGYEWIARQP